jgi:hypothetical protein
LSSWFLRERKTTNINKNKTKKQQKKLSKKEKKKREESKEKKLKISEWERKTYFRSRGERKKNN